MSDFLKRNEKGSELGWSPSDAAGFAPWLEDFSWQPLKRFRQWRKFPVLKPYISRKWHAAELHSTYSALQSQIFEQRIYEHELAGSAVSGYFIYELRGTRSFAKELSLWLQGYEEYHDQDVEKFLSMADRLNKRATGYALPSSIRIKILDRNSKSQNQSEGDIPTGTAGHGYSFSNYNAASARETWARQYLLKIRAPDRTKLLAERRSQLESAGKVYTGFDPETWGLKIP
jgi:hypothetical protein